jgi:spore germination protein YaaH
MKAFLVAPKISKNFRATFLSLISITSLVLSTLVFIPSSSAGEPRKILTTWIPYYNLKTYLPAALNSSSMIKEVMPFWYTLNYNTSTKTPTIKDLYTPGNPSIPMATPLAALRGAGYKIIPTITDGTTKLVLANALANPDERTKIITQISNLVMTNNYDGIDLDFENFAFIDGRATWVTTEPAWVAFIQELSRVLHANNKMLSIDTPYQYGGKPTDVGYYIYAWAKIAPFIDRLRIMTYDYSVSKPGPIGPLSWVEKTVQYAVSVMPASKVWVGLPGYGKDWVTSVSGVCPANYLTTVKVGAKAATFLMNEAQTLASTYGVAPVYNAQYDEMSFSYQKTYSGNTSSGLSTSCVASRTAWYQNAQSYSSRTALVAKYKLGGVATWILGMEEPLALQAIANIAATIAPAKVLSSMKIDKNTIDYGTSVQVTGVLTLEDKLPLSSAPLRIEGKSAGESTWRVLAQGTTAIDGTFSAPLLLAKPTTIRIATDATWERMESLSNVESISVTRLVSISAPLISKIGSPFVITGFVRPRTGGVQVVLKQFVAGTWKKVGVPVSTSADGTFTFSQASDAVARGVLAYQVEVSQDATFAVVTSAPFSIIVR